MLIAKGVREIFSKWMIKGSDDNNNAATTSDNNFGNDKGLKYVINR